MKQINLLPESELKELHLELASKQLLKFFSLLVISLLLLFVLGLATRYLIKTSISANDIQVEQLQKQLASSDNQALQKQLIDLNSKMKNLQLLNQKGYHWSEALTEIGNLSPADFHLDLLTLDRSTGEIVMNGTTDRRASVIDFWSAVHKSKYFSKINFPLNNLEKATDTPFTFTFYLNPETITNKP